MRMEESHENRGIPCEYDGVNRVTFRVIAQAFASGSPSSFLISFIVNLTPCSTVRVIQSSESTPSSSIADRRLDRIDSFALV